MINNLIKNGGKEDCISINHNWGNSCNIDLFWDFLRSELEEVMIEIEDCKNENEEWENLCQTLMKANSGSLFLFYFLYYYNNIIILTNNY